MNLTTLLQLFIIALFPWLSRRISRIPGIGSWLSPVILCYALGILLGNLGLFPIHKEMVTVITEITIVLAIPLLLFSTDLKIWLSQSRTVLLSFGLCVISGLLGTHLIAILLQEQVKDSWQIAGMLVGIYTGGTPNMQAIGLALNVDQEKIVLLNAADILCGGLLLIFLTSIAHRLYGLFLRSYRPLAYTAEAPQSENVTTLHWRPVLFGIGLSAMIVGMSLGVCYLLFGDIAHTAVIILLLTSFSIIASIWNSIRQLKGAYESGDYFLLMFCVALGMLADFEILVNQGSQLILFTALALSTTLLFHLLLSYLFKIDRDTVMITFTAAIYGPAFIGQIANTINNKQLVFAGIAMGLLGYAIGNYLGITSAYFLHWLL